MRFVYALLAIALGFFIAYFAFVEGDPTAPSATHVTQR